MKRLLFIGVFILGATFLAIAHPVRAVTPPIASHVLLAQREADENPNGEDQQTQETPPPVFTPSPTPPLTQPSAIAPQVPEPLANTTTAVTSPAPTLISTSQAPTTNPVISTNFPWAWILTRSAGIASYILLALLSVTGMLLSTGLFYRYVSPATAWSVHRAIGSVLLFSVVAHLIGTYLDNFIQLRIVDILIPFVSPYKTIFVALGIFGFYLLLLILATSLYTMTSHAKFWRTIHFFSFPMFILILLHSMLLGSDAKFWWIKSINIGMASLVGVAVIYRLVWKYQAKKRLPPVTV